MKYGPIICDPNSEEAKALIGKKILGGYNYVDTDCGVGELLTLDSIDASYQSPFLGHTTSGTKYTYTFIREAVEEPPEYRPYKDTDEMVEDFKKRFCKHTTIPQDAMPLIWVTFPNGPKEIVSAFGKNTVWLNGDCFMLDYIFETGYTYLDGSPVGKEEA